VARLGRSNNRLDRTVLVACAVLSVIALVLPTQVREPIASVLRRGLLAPMLRLQQSAEESRRALSNHDAVVSKRDSVAWRAMGVESLETENNRLRDLLGLGSRLKWGFVPAEALHGRGVRDEVLIEGGVEGRGRGNGEARIGQFDPPGIAPSFSRRRALLAQLS